MLCDINTNIAWSAGQLARDAAWRHRLTAQELAELDRALARANASGKPTEWLRARDFPLHALACTLQRLAAELEYGRGVVLVDGLPLQHYGERARRRLFWGLSQYLGRCVSQSGAGELMMHVRDAGGGPDAPHGDGMHGGSLRYGTDLCDVVGMLSLQTAAEGGESLLVSSLAVHNEIRRTRPDLLQALYRPCRHARPHLEGNGAWPPDMRSVFAVHERCFVSTYRRECIDAAHDGPGTPRLPPLQAEALDYLDRLCNDARFSHAVLLEPGQMLFFNSFVTYHACRAFRNHAHPRRHRDLLRLWLSVPHSRALPEAYRTAFGATGAGALRGGIHSGRG